MALNIDEKDELKRLRAESARAHAFLEQIGEAANIGGWEVNIANSEVYWSPTTHRIHGTDLRSYQPVLSEGLDFYVPEDRPIIIEHFSRLVNDGKPFSLDLRIKRADGVIRWIHTIGLPFEDGEQRLKVYGTFQDIHESKIKELVTKNQDQQLALLLSTFKFGIWDWDIPTDRLSWDASMFDLFGVEQDRFQGKFEDWQRCLHPEDVSEAVHAATEALKTSERFNNSFRIIMSDGSVKRIRGSAIIYRDEQGTPIRLIGINYDITQEIRSSERLSHLEALVEASPDIFGIAGRNGEIIFLNEAARRLGWDESSAFADIFPIESIAQYANEIFPILKAEGRWHGEILFRDNIEGTEFPVMQSSFLLRDGEGKTTAVATIASDLREKKKLEAELESRRLKMVQSAKMISLGEMASGMAHEINNPLAIIKGNVSLLQMQIQDKNLDETRMKKGLETIDTAIDRVAQIIKGLRSFARDPSKDPMAIVSIAKLIEDTAKFFQARFQNAGVRLEIFTPSPLIHVNGRETELNQALFNLVMNAYDAAKAKSVGWVKLDCIIEESRVMIRVIDSGDPIPKATQDRVMEPFFTTKTVGQGTGLGLSISRGIANTHGGELFLDKEAPNTTFILQLPLRN